MFMEGIYLYMMVAIVFSSDKFKLKVYVAAGWSKSIVKVVK